MKLTAMQSKLLDAIPDDGEYHRFPTGTRSQTILSLANRKLIKLRERSGMTISPYYDMRYDTVFEAIRQST